MVLGTVALLAAIALAGCSAGGSGGSSGSSITQPSAPDAVKPGTVAGSDASGGKQSNVDRSIVMTGTLSMSVDDPIRASARAVDIVDSAGGRIDSRNQSATGGAETASLTLRIPAKRLDATVASLQKLGRTDQLQLDASDVTNQSQDLGARITALRTTIQRLLQLEQQATATTDLISIETAIGDRQADLESLEAQQRGLADQVAMSTISLQLHARSSAAPQRGTFWDGVLTGWNAFVGFWQGFLVVVGVLLPWLVLAAIIGAAAAIIARWRVRVARRRA